MTETYTWMTDQVVYEIFPDRFAIGQPYTSESKLALPAYHRATDYVRKSWDESPVNPAWGKDFFGGDLNGITDHLGYLQELGATAIFTTPIFSAPSNHKYDATDFFSIDEQFGEEEALRNLIQHMHDSDMRLIMDVALNHISDIHPWFLDAKHGEQQKKDYFMFNPDGSYQCWHDHCQMPELNLDNPILQGILYKNTDSVLQKYLAMGLDGWRFDVAVDLGLNVAKAMRLALQEQFPSAVMIGEVTNYAAEWTNGDDRYHGVMNYYFRDAVLSWLRGGVVGGRRGPPSFRNAVLYWLHGGDSARQMNAAAEEYYQGYGMGGALCSWNILSSHDTPRLANMLPDKAQRQLAVIAQFTLPGVPMIYYGEEIGMEGGNDPDCRRPMIWDRQRWDMETFNFYQKLIAIRQSRAELRRGKLIMLGDQLDTDAIAFIRHTDTPNEVSVVLINNAKTTLKMRLFTPHSHLYHALPMKNLLCPEQNLIQMGMGNLDVDIPPRSAAILVPSDDQFKNYKFFKERNLA